MASSSRVLADGRPWVIGAVVLLVTGTLGVVATASAVPDLAGRTPGIAGVFRLNDGATSTGMAVTWAVAAAVASVAGLAVLWRWARHGWPWLLFAGVLLTLPPEFGRLVTGEHSIAGTTGWTVLAAFRVAAAQLVLIGALGAAVRLVRIGAHGAGAVLFGLAFGAQVFGASLASVGGTVEIMILRPGDEVRRFAKAVLYDGLTVAAVGGAFLVVVLYRIYGARPELDGPPGADTRTGVRVTIAGGAALAALVPVAALCTQGGRITETGFWALLAAGLVTAVASGWRALAGTLVAALVGVGISGPTHSLILAESDRVVRMWFLIAVGVVIGTAAVFPRWRAWTAAGGCAAAGALLLVFAALGTGSGEVLLLLVLPTAATAGIGAVGAWLAEDAAPMLGGSAVVATLGAAGLLVPRSGNTPGQVVDHYWWYAALLLVAAGGIALAGRVGTGHGSRTGDGGGARAGA